MILLTACLVLAGCISLALSQDRNWKAVTDVPPRGRARGAMRLIGWLALGVAFALSVVTEGPGFAVLLWTLQIAVASFGVAMILSFFPGTFRPVARVYAALWP